MGDADSPLAARAAGGVLVFGGAVTLGTGLWFLSLTGSDALWRWLLGVVVESAGETPALVRGSQVSALVNVGVPAVGVLFCLVAGAQLLTGLWAYRGERGRRPLAAALVGAVNPLAAPVSALAVVFLLYRRRVATTAGRGSERFAND